MELKSCPICSGEVMLMGDRVFIKDFGYFVKEKTGHMEIVKSGPCYIVYRYTCCGYEHSESKADMGASEVPPHYCPYCGAKIEG